MCEELQRTRHTYSFRKLILLKREGVAWGRQSIKEGALFFFQDENCVEERINGEENEEETGKKKHLMDWGPEDCWEHEDQSILAGWALKRTQVSKGGRITFTGRLCMLSVSCRWDEWLLTPGDSHEWSWPSLSTSADATWVVGCRWN